MTSHEEKNAQPTIAVLGASPLRHKFGNKCVRAFLDAGYQVFPVNPTADEIEGQRVYRNLDDVPRPVDAVSVYLPPPVTFEYLPDIARTQANKVWFNPGAADAQVLEEARRQGIAALDACSIVAIGRSPAQYP